MRIKFDRLKSKRPHSFGSTPPWIPLSTGHAARLLRVHPQTLLAWRAAGIGPVSEPKDKYVGRTGTHVYWLGGKLVEWWESLVLPAKDRRTFEQICDEWRSKNAVLLAIHKHWPGPRLRGVRRRQCPCGAQGCWV